MPEPLALLALTLTGCVTALALMSLTAGGERRRLDKRMQHVKERSLGLQPLVETAGSTSLRRHARISRLDMAYRWLTRRIPRTSGLQRRLERAGITVGPAQFLVAAGIVSLCVMAAAAAALKLTLPLAAATGLLAGIALPHLFLSWRISGRTHGFIRQFPDIIDLMVRGIRSGLPITESIQAAAREGEAITAGIFAEVAGNLQLGMSLDEALWAVSKRLQIQEFKFFVISLSIQQETGGNLADILANLSRMMRRREQVKMKIRAMSSEARASAMIIGSLPFVMMLLLYVINAEYIAKLFTDPRGWLLLGAGALSMGSGLGIMAKMVRFEI